MTDVVGTGSLLKSPKAQVNTFAALVTALAGWAHMRVFELEKSLSETRATLAAVQATTEATAKPIDNAIAKLEGAVAEQRAATSRLEVAIAELRYRKR